jgi:hypothetical protein
MLSSIQYPENSSSLTRATPFRLQLVGEASPRLDEKFVQITSQRSSGADEVPIYEYLWTLAQVDCPSDDASKPQEPLAVRKVEVRMDFAEMSGWSISEPIGTVKFMSPAPRRKDGLLNRTQKSLEVASKAAGLIPGGASASKWMEAASQLEATSLPQSGNFDWGISTSAVKHGTEVRQRIAWKFPKDMFETLGRLLTGGLAIAFIGDKSKTSESLKGLIYISAVVQVENGRRLFVVKRLGGRLIPPQDLSFPLAFQNATKQMAQKNTAAARSIRGRPIP